MDAALRFAVLVAALYAVLLVPARIADAQEPGRPNVLIILVDDLGYGDLSAYGAPDLRTPHVDALIARGMRFENFYANCPVCSPTRAALLSGRYQDLVGVPGVIRTHPENNWGHLAADAVLLPKLLGEAGYHTAIVGKWHLGLEAPNRPTDRGFDHFAGFLGDMMDDYYNHRRHGINYMRQGEQEIDPEGHATDLFSRYAVEYLEQRRAANANADAQPFFLYLAYNAPHTPIQPPEDWLAKVKQRAPQMPEKRQKLVALIEHMDDGIGRVLQALQSTGFADNTLVVFTSDNGGQVEVGAHNGPWRDGKQSVYEGGLRVAATAAWPGKIEAGSRTELMALSMDIFPTVCEAAGVKIPHKIDGVSFLPTLLGKEQPPLRTTSFFRRREGGLRYGGKTIEAVIDGNWKLLQNSPYQPLELYDLKTDPYEQENLAAKRPQVVRRLSGVLSRELQRYGAVHWQRPGD